MVKGLVKQFKPTIFFLGKFVGLYLVLNLSYGLFVNSFHPRPDPATVWVTQQTADILNRIGWETTIWDNPSKPNTSIVYDGRGIVSVYEGCNGINVAIIFFCFILSFGPLNKKLLWFAPLGLVTIHIFNLGRIFLLFLVVIFLPDYVYFTHKYLFTAIIYFAVFGLWLIWIRINYLKPG